MQNTISPTKKYFKIGSRVNGVSFQNKRIFGEYRGARASFGVWVFGIEVGSFDPPKMHVCQALTLEAPPEPKIRRGPGRPYRFKSGDPVSGRTETGEIIVGFYQNKVLKHAWIRGWKESQNKFELKEAHKVLYRTLARRAK